MADIIDGRSQLHIPPDVAEGIRSMRPDLLSKISLHDIDSLTKPLRKRIAALEAERDEARAEALKLLNHCLSKHITERDYELPWEHPLEFTVKGR